jgi:hypothetical protein
MIAAAIDQACFEQVARRADNDKRGAGVERRYGFVAREKL